MSKKIIVITISIALLLFLGVLIAYYFNLQNKSAEQGVEDTGFFSFLPFGGDDTPITTEPPENIPPEENNLQENYTQKLRLLSAEPVAGAGTLEVTAGTVVRYIEKATGHIYETELFSPIKNRISNATIPVVYNSLWGGNASNIFASYLADDNMTINNYGLEIRNFSTSTDNTVSAVQFPPNISDASSFENSIFYLQRTSDGTVGYTASFNGNSKKQVWSSPIKELLPQYINQRTVSLTTKPGVGVGGYMFFVDTVNGQVKTILRNIPALSTHTNHDATNVLYSNGLATYIYNITNKTSNSISPFTFPEKCVWSKKDKNVFYCAVPKGYLDSTTFISWYKGLVSFNDDIWKYSINENTAVIVSNLIDDAGTNIDAINLKLSEKEQYIVFMNKIDNTLWSLDLTK